MTRPPLDGQGCTPERKRHSHIKGTVREVTPGGMVLSYGDTDTEHCYLDWLRSHGLLGPEEDAQPRYDAGYHVRELWYRWHTSAKAMTGEPGSSDKRQHLPDHDTDADLAEQDYHDIMELVPFRYRDMVRAMCIGEPRRFDITSKTRSAIYSACEEARDGLDELLRAIGRMERQKRDRQD